MIAEQVCSEGEIAQATADMPAGSVAVVFKCGHVIVDPKRAPRRTQFVCSECGRIRQIAQVIGRCIVCGALTYGKRVTRKYCVDCYRHRQTESSRTINLRTRALKTAYRSNMAHGDLLEVVAAALGVSKQRVQQMEAIGSRVFKKKFKSVERRPGLVFEGFVFLDGNMVIGPRSVTGSDRDDAAAELMLDLWEYCRANRLDKPRLEQIEMVVFPVSDVFQRAR